MMRIDEGVGELKPLQNSLCFGRLPIRCLAFYSLGISFGLMSESMLTSDPHLARHGLLRFQGQMKRCFPWWGWIHVRRRFTTSRICRRWWRDEYTPRNESKSL